MEFLIKKANIAVNASDARPSRFVGGERIDQDIAEINREKRKVFLINGRLSEKSFQNYKRLLFFMDNIFSKINFIVCQGMKDLDRFIKLGVNEKQIKRDFSFKFDSLQLNQNSVFEKNHKMKDKKMY